MTKKCIGCGIELQDININMEGYTNNIDNNLCLRCFKISNYNEYSPTTRNNVNYLNIIDSIKKSNDLVIYTLNLFDMPKLDNINNLLGDNIILCLTKRDLLPKSLIDDKIINYFKNKLNYKDIEIINSLKNYNIDSLFNKINKHKNSNNIYIVGNTNSGKSTLTNKLIKNYSTTEAIVTTSMFPSTTLDSIEIIINKDLSLIDTPGLIDEDNIINHVEMSTVKLISPKKEIKPRTYQLNNSGSLIIDKLCRIDYLTTKCSIVIYINNTIDIKHTSTNNSNFKESPNIKITANNEDIVISGLCFIKVIGHLDTTIYTNYKDSIFTRDSLI